MLRETAFDMATSNIRFGSGVTRELGMDLSELGVRRTMLVTDRRLRDLPPVLTALESLQKERIDYEVFDRVSIEPTDASFQDGIDFASAEPFDAFVAVGGGSSIDTAKAANLYSTYPPDDFLDYVNAPIGNAQPVPGPLKPLIAVPTTAGTGSETTGVAIFDFQSQHAKTGISHRRLKPNLGLIDPENTKTQPSQVAAATGLDVLSHAIESYTALPFHQRTKAERPIQRPAYQGSNPISDVWSLTALRMVSEFLPRAVEDTTDDEARGAMMLAASFAGIGFGNAGVHLPHGMSYPVSSQVRTYSIEGYSQDKPLVPHGISVILNAPAVFRFTSTACPDRHLIAAQALGADVSDVSEEDAGEILASKIIDLMKRLGIPNGLKGVGYSENDIPRLVEGTLPQHRLTKLSPRIAEAEDLKVLFHDALTYW